MTERTPRRVAHSLTALVAVVALAACTIDTNEDPVPLSAGPLEPTTTTTTIPDGVTTKDISVYFLADSSGRTRLIDVERSVPVGAGIQEKLASLFTVRVDAEGTERENELGLTSAIPDDATLVRAELVPGTNRLVVSVRGLFGAVQGPRLRDALAQIVWTATEDDQVSEVTFQNDGGPVPAAIDGGEVVDRAVRRRDYSAVT